MRPASEHRSADELNREPDILPRDGSKVFMVRSAIAASSARGALSMITKEAERLHGIAQLALDRSGLFEAIVEAARKHVHAVNDEVDSDADYWFDRLVERVKELEDTL